MQTVTNEQIYDRWEQVPESLREAFFSTDNGEIVWKACEDAGLSEDVIDNVLLVVGNILFGFTHINDLAKELQSIPGMDPKAVDPIIFQIDKRIFEPVKVEILKLYGEMSGNAPRMVAEEKPKAVEPNAPAMIGEQVEMRRVKMGDEQKEEVVAPIPATRPEPTEGPTIIHMEAELKPVAQKRRPLSSFGGMFGFRRDQGEKKEGPAVATQASMIEGLGKRPENTAKPEQQPPVRVVHYMSAKAPEDMFAQPAQPRVVPPVVPVTKQEHAVDFEPKIVDMAGKTEPPVVAMGEPGKIVPVPAMTDETMAPTPPMPSIPTATVMKTPQRVETVVMQEPQMKEPQLAEIPVHDEVVDLRMLERIPEKKMTE